MGDVTGGRFDEEQGAAAEAGTPADAGAPERVDPQVEAPAAAEPAGPVAPGPAMPGWTQPPVRQKPKTIWWLFFAGLVTPIAVFGLLFWALQFVPTTPATEFIANGVLVYLLVLLSFAAFLVTLLTARAHGRTRLASFSKGAMWAYALIPLGFLLLFGACLFPQGA